MLKNYKIAARLGLGFGLVILLLILMSVLTRIKLGELSGLTVMLYKHPFTVSTSLADAETDIVRIERTIRDILLSENPDELSRYREEIDRLEKRIYDNLKIVRDNYLGNPGDIDAILKEMDAWKIYRNKVIALMQANKRQEAVAFQKGEATLHMEGLKEKLGVIDESTSNKAATFVQGAQETANTTYVFIYIVLCLTLVVSVAIALLTSRSITRPLKKAVDVANRIAVGDLNIRLPPVEIKDEVGELIQAFGIMMQYLQKMADVAGQIAARDLNARVEPQSTGDILGNAFLMMITNLRTVLTEIHESANVVAASVSEILVTTNQLAAGIAETATSVSQTTATVEEVKQTAKLSAEKSRNVSENAQEAALVADQGNMAVNETIEGINHIRELMETVAESVVVLSEQTQTIGDVIMVVNDLAQQSNLLAVNAAIEASKAGEQGKGFVVVAQEIKSLADQSKLATEQVRSILGDIQKATGRSVLAAEQVSKAVENGASQAAESGESIRKLADGISESAQAAVQIAASSQQQLVGMEQVAMAMENIKQAAQQNVAGTNQAEQAAHSLNELGQRLKEMVERYKV